MIREIRCFGLSRRVGEDIIGRVKDSCLLPRTYSGDVPVSTSSHHGSVEESVSGGRDCFYVSQSGKENSFRVMALSANCYHFSGVGSHYSFDRKRGLQFS